MKTNSRTARRLIRAGLLSAVATILALLALAGSEGHSRTTGRTIAIAAPLSPAVARADRPAGTGLVPGDFLRYRFAIRRTTRVTAQLSEVAPVTSATRMAGRFSMHVLDGRALFRIERVEAASGRLNDAMRGEVLVEIDSLGSLGRIAFPENMPPRGRAVWKDLLGHWQIVHPSGALQTEWETEESDTTGRYRARYELRTPVGEMPREVVKRRLGFVRLNERGNIKLAAPKLEGEVRFVLDPLVVRIEGRERFTLAIPDLQRCILSETAIEFVREAHEHRPTAARPLPACTTTMDDTSDLTAGVDHEQVRRDARGTIGDIDRLVAAGLAESDGMHNLLVRLVGLLEDSPAAVAEIMLRIPTAPEKLGALLAPCLGAAGTPAAQEGLARIMKIRPRLRPHAVVAAVRVREPGAVLDRALLALRADPDFADDALLALGAVGSRVPKSEKERVASIRSHLDGALAGARDPNAIATALVALGNFGPSTVPQAVRRALDHDIAGVRGAAARALLRIPKAEADALLTRIASGDASEHTRRVALETLILRHRRGWTKRPSSALRDLLEGIARNDASKRLRRLAASGLAALA